MARRNYDPEVKAAAMASLLAGQSVNSVAREYKIPPGTISNWKNRGVVPSNGIQKRKEEIGELLTGYLEENLKTLKAQAIIFRNEDWLMQQPAQEAAVLHGVLTDKAVRLLEAMSNVPDDNAS